MERERERDQSKWYKVIGVYHERGLAVRLMTNIFEYRLFSLRSDRLAPATWAMPLLPNFMLNDRASCHVSELSKITGIVLDMRSRSYKESMPQELAAHLINHSKSNQMSA